MANTEAALRAGKALVDERSGILQRVTLSPSPPDEPAIYNTTVERNSPDELTDGRSFDPTEGGCSLDPEQAVVSAIGEAIERYCASIYRRSELVHASFDDLEHALDPNRVVNFSTAQIASDGFNRVLYTHGDELGWVEGVDETTGEETMLPGQLVYLTYEEPSDPFIRETISTGLAAGMTRSGAKTRAVLEVVERDAFMIYYLTRTPLPRIDVSGCGGDIQTITDRLDQAGLDWHVLDARTDHDVPTVVSVIIDESTEPAVTVAASAARTIRDAVRGALEEAIQTRLYQRYHLENGAESVDLQTVATEDIDQDTRLLGWAHSNARTKLSFWTEADRIVPLSQIRSESNIDDSRSVIDTVSTEWDLYSVNITTRDVAQAGFVVVRAIAPAAQPLYLREVNRYWDESRLRTVPDAVGHPTDAPTDEPLTAYPHPFP